MFSRLNAGRVLGICVRLANTCPSLKPKQALLASSRMNSTGSYTFETLAVSKPQEHVVQVELNRPEKRNAMNKTFWREMVECFRQIGDDSDCRAVVLTGAGKIFTAGLDLMDMGSDLMTSGKDPSRQAHKMRKLIQTLQESFLVIEKCPQPVIAAVHSGCVGGGIDMVCSCDIRLCSADAWFQVKEIDIGLAADLGTLQRFPKIIGNDSLARELCFTGRRFTAEEALKFGFVSRICSDRDSVVKDALELASQIAKKSPVAMSGIKHNLNFSRDHSVQEGMEYMITWNMAMLQTEDILKAVQAGMSKEDPVFSKL
ncbi:Putative enoyl CoA hydratase [Desmophyllum pertusum]|uniref:Delta(3,5)-Delta(2,4)-dienoyl-CoA isomerase, mitochondrial n=1 Tax=Desmophyllum pertusum TaxID=174260 RepID=A0A9X0CLP1_9CNID|nr:Putative enoyl CoA hydratase [Desmophyllum pertusum]